MNTFNPILTGERQGEVFGVQGRFTGITVRHDESPNAFCMQKWISQARPIKGYGEPATLRVEIRFDDSCRNGHNTFAITGEVIATRAKRRRDDNYLAGGCLHEEIAQVFPELAPLIKWHLASTDGPMHYVANASYFASDRDHFGKRKGEVTSTETVLQFGKNPITHKLKKGFLKFLREHKPLHGDKPFAFQVLPVPYVQKPGHTDYKFSPKFTFSGYGVEWHYAPFDSEAEAEAFLEALNTCDPHFVTRPTAWSEGKARELDKARAAAIWPDATDAELMAEPAELKAALAGRLAGLIAEMRRDLEAAGFVWNRDSLEAGEAV